MKSKIYGPALEKSLLKRFLGFGVYRYAGEFLSFMSSIVLSRFLGPEEYGLVAMIVIFYGFFSKFTDIGLSDAIVREPNKEYFLESVHIIYIGKGLVLAGFMALASYPISLFFDRPILQYVGLTYAAALFLYAFPKAAIASLRKQEKLTLIAKVEFWAVIFHALLSIILAVSGFSYWALVIPHVCTPFFYIIFYRRYVQIPFRFHRSALKDAWNRVKSLVYSFGALNFFQYWEQQADIFMVGKLYGVGRLGLYNRAYTLTNLPMNLLIPQINIILLPVISNLNYSRDQLRLELIRVIKLILSVCIIPFAIFVLFPYEISVFLWGEEWRQVGNYVQVLCLIILLQGFILASRSLYVLFKKERKLLEYGLISGTVNVVLVVIGAYYSIELMIYLLVGGMLFINLPLCMYIGYYKAFGFTAYQIWDIVSYNYIGAIVVLALHIFQLEQFIIYPVILLVVMSVTRTADSFVKWRSLLRR